MLIFWEMVGIALTYVFSTCSLALSLFFFKKLRETRRNTRELLPFLALAILALTQGIGFIFASWLDYYRWSEGRVVLELWKGFSSMQIFSDVSFLVIHKYVYKKTKYLISAFVLSGMIPILFMNDFALENLIQIIWGIPGFLLGIPLYYLIFLKRTTGYLRKRMNLTFLGLFLVAAGSFLRSSTLETTIGFQGLLYSYSVGTICLLTGISLMGYGFATFSTFSDLHWKGKLRELYVISDAGLCLYAFSFDQKQTMQDSDLVAGGFSGIQTLLAEITRTKESLQQLDYKDMKIILEQKENIMFVLVIKEPSTYLPYKLRVFSEQFRAFFRESFENWSGNASIFLPTKNLIEKTFELGEVRE